MRREVGGGAGALHQMHLAVKVLQHFTPTQHLVLTAWSTYACSPVTISHDHDIVGFDLRM